MGKVCKKSIEKKKLSISTRRVSGDKRELELENYALKTKNRNMVEHIENQKTTLAHLQSINESLAKEVFQIKSKYNHLVYMISQIYGRSKQSLQIMSNLTEFFADILQLSAVASNLDNDNLIPKPVERTPVQIRKSILQNSFKENESENVTDELKVPDKNVLVTKRSRLANIMPLYINDQDDVDCNDDDDSENDEEENEQNQDPSAKSSKGDELCPIPEERDSELDLSDTTSNSIPAKLKNISILLKQLPENTNLTDTGLDESVLRASTSALASKSIINDSILNGTITKVGNNENSLADATPNVQSQNVSAESLLADSAKLFDDMQKTTLSVVLKSSTPFIVKKKVRRLLSDSFDLDDSTLTNKSAFVTNSRRPTSKDTSNIKVVLEQLSDEVLHSYPTQNENLSPNSTVTTQTTMGNSNLTTETMRDSNLTRTTRGSTLTPETKKSGNSQERRPLKRKSPRNLPVNNETSGSRSSRPARAARPKVLKEANSKRKLRRSK